MNRRERKVLEKYQSEGWKYLDKGAPDFIFLKVSDDGKDILDAIAVEVKSPRSDLTYEQAVFRKFLQEHGIRYKVEVVE